MIWRLYPAVLRQKEVSPAYWRINVYKILKRNYMHSTYNCAYSSSILLSTEQERIISPTNLFCTSLQWYCYKFTHLYLTKMEQINQYWKGNLFFKSNSLSRELCFETDTNLWLQNQTILHRPINLQIPKDFLTLQVQLSGMLIM